MHPRQAKLITASTEVADNIGEPKEAATNLVWKYVDPDNGPFYLLERRMTVRSPWTGQSMTVRPERINPSQVGRDVKEEFKAPVPEEMPLMAASDKARPEKSWKA